MCQFPTKFSPPSLGRGLLQGKCDVKYQPRSTSRGTRCIPSVAWGVGKPTPCNTQRLTALGQLRRDPARPASAPSPPRRFAAEARGLRARPWTGAATVAAPILLLADLSGFGGERGLDCLPSSASSRCSSAAPLRASLSSPASSQDRPDTRISSSASSISSFSALRLSSGYVQCSPCGGEGRGENRNASSGAGVEVDGWVALGGGRAPRQHSAPLPATAACANPLAWQCG